MFIALNRQPLHLIRAGTISLQWTSSRSARTVGDARTVATGLELSFQEFDAAPADDVTTKNASAFRDDKLYTVLESESGRVDLTRSVFIGGLSLA